MLGNEINFFILSSSSWPALSLSTGGSDQKGGSGPKKVAPAPKKMAPVPKKVAPAPKKVAMLCNTDQKETLHGQQCFILEFI